MKTEHNMVPVGTHDWGKKIKGDVLFEAQLIGDEVARQTLCKVKAKPADIIQAIEKYLREAAIERLNEIGIDRRIEAELDRRLEVAVSTAVKGAQGRIQSMVESAIRTRIEAEVRQMPLSIAVSAEK